MGRWVIFSALCRVFPLALPLISIILANNASGLGTTDLPTAYVDGANLAGGLALTLSRSLSVQS